MERKKYEAVSLYPETVTSGDILIENSESNDRERSEEDVVARHVPVVISRLAGEGSVSLEPEESEPECNVLVKEIAHLHLKQDHSELQHRSKARLFEDIPRFDSKGIEQQ